MEDKARKLRIHIIDNENNFDMISEKLLQLKE